MDYVKLFLGFFTDAFNIILDFPLLAAPLLLGVAIMVLTVVITVINKN